MFFPGRRAEGFSGFLKRLAEFVPACSVPRKRVRFDRAAEFLAACASGDTEEAALMLKETRPAGAAQQGQADIIDCTNADGITALHQVSASSRRRTPVRVEAPTRLSCPCSPPTLPQACIDGSMEMVSFLLEHQASVNQADSEGWTPLHVAASCGYPDIAEWAESRLHGPQRGVGGGACV